MKFFIDTNVLIDRILNRCEFLLEAGLFMSAIVNGVAEGFASSHSLADLFYITRKNLSLERRRVLIMFLIANAKVVPGSYLMFDNALNDRSFHDLEDGLQQQCAKIFNLDFIVTQNLKDFDNSNEKAISIKEALSLL